MRIIGLLIGWLFWSLANQAASFSGEGFAKAAVAKIRAYHANGTVTLGSAVLLGGERLATNCHVTDAARSTEVIYGGHRWQARIEAQDVGHDLCIIRAPGISGIPAAAAPGVTLGQTVFAVGFPGGNSFTVTEGRVVALHDYDGAKVIQVSSPFDFGASGGGLFDEDGRLMGILTFKARAGGVFHFALPIAWARSPERPEAERSAGPAVAFWQQPFENQPYFLRAVTLEANQNWSALAALGEQWTTERPMDPGAWTALGKAFSHLPRRDEAALALARAERLRVAEEPGELRHAASLTYVSTEFPRTVHPVRMALPGFDPTAIKLPAHGTQ